MLKTTLMTRLEENITEKIREISRLSEIDEIANHAALSAFSFGLKYWHFATVYDLKSQEFDKGIGNFPQSFYQEYFENNLRFIDPAVSLVQFTNKPFIFSENFGKIKDERSLKVINCFRNVGIKDGFGIPVHGAGGYHGFVAWAAENKLELNQPQKSLLHAYSCVLYHKIEDARGLLNRKTLMKRDLSKREREILLWVLEGKQNNEIGKILRISENTVKYHLKRICLDLDVNSRIHAAIKALHIGALN